MFNHSFLLVSSPFDSSTANKSSLLLPVVSPHLIPTANPSAATATPSGLASEAGCQSSCCSHEQLSDPSDNLRMRNRLAIDHIHTAFFEYILRFKIESLSPMENYLTAVSEWYSSIMIAMALSWLLWRATQVLMKPAEELIQLLGLDVPIAPSLALAGLKADGISIRWTPLDQKSARNYNLTINGITVGEISPADLSLDLIGLIPDHGYIIRIVAVSSVGFTGTSSPLSIQTKAKATGDFFVTSSRATEPSDASTTSVIIRPSLILSDISSSSNGGIPMQREHSGSISHQQKRNVSGRRHTHGSHTASDHDLEMVAKPTESDSTDKSYYTGSSKLRSEIEQNQLLAKSEEEKYEIEYDNLSKVLQDVQQQLNNKNNTTKKLNQHVATLNTEESAARKDKAALDKQLEKVMQERQKMEDDMNKWKAESSEIEERILQLSSDQAEYEKSARSQVSKMKTTFSNEKAKNDAMEEGIKTTIARIKQLEEQTKQLEDSNGDSNGAAQHTVEEEQAWNRQWQELQLRCHNLTVQQQQGKTALANDQAVLDMWRQYYLNQSQSYQVPYIDEAPVRRNSGQHNERSNSLSGFAHASTSGFGISPSFPTAGPLFNISNGTMRFSDRLMSPTAVDPSISNSMSPNLDFPSDTHSGARADSDARPEEVPNSPSTMNEFLPSDLLAAGDDFESRYGAIGQRMRMGRENSNNCNILPGLGAPETLEDYAQGPSSPISLNSRSPSILTSPRGSNMNLPGAVAFGDADRGSIRSATGSARATSGGGSGTKFSSLFRPQRRTKGSSDEGPTLGSLRSNESQSMPRPDGEDDIPEGSAPTSRRRGSHSGPSWMDQMLGRANTSIPAEETRKNRFTTLFGGAKKNDPWGDDNSSPRPGSINSVESHGLPRPSAESVSRFGWASGDSTSSQLGKSIPGLGWRNGVQASWGPTLHSRNTSMPQGHTLEHSTFDNNKIFSAVAQAPIGTRPRTPIASESRPHTSTTPLRLNPNAPTFTGVFGNGDEASKNGKSNGNETSARSDITSHNDFLHENGRSSPLDSRKSRDGNSILSTEYASDTRDSFDHSMSSAAPSESGAAPKESFMRKLTRKSSAGFTSLAGRRGPGGKKPSTAAIAAAAATDEAMEGSQTTDDEMSKSTATLGEDTPKDKGMMSPLLGSGGSVRGFSLRNLRRKKGDRSGSVEGEDNDDIDNKP